MAKITAYEVSGAVDYSKIIKEFGVKQLETGPDFYMFRRRIAFAHRDFDLFFSRLAGPSAIVCGRGPSENVHLGHLVPYLLVKYFHDKYNTKVYIPFSDDEKYFARKLELEQVEKYALENALDILALGFSPEKTKIVLDFKHIGHYYKYAALFAKRTTFSTVKGIFGFSESTNIGLIFYPALQTTHIMLPFLEEKIENILVIVGIDQDPYMRLVRDLAAELSMPKPASLYVKYLPPLTGLEGKMSASNPSSAIYLTDNEETVKRKLKNAVTGGAKSLEEQKKYGGNPEKCTVYFYFYFLCPDDSRIEKIYQECRTGERTCKECKEELAEFLLQFLSEHRQRKEEIKERLKEYFLYKES
ncbi:MAG: tryptophan--tRNA ligase [bacterium]|nr:tryptophan--tRNA ligase [bacterium]